jgi:RNA polymerase sigma-70 factor, ECF subfamily
MEGQSHARSASREPEPHIEDAAAARDLAVSRAVARAQSGDRDALAYIYVRFADDICGYARSIVHDHHAAEDVTQQVFTKLIRVIGKYQERDVPFFAWMLRVTRNCALDHLRKQTPLPVEEVRGEYGRGCVPGEGHVSELVAALATLPHAQREVLVLRHLAGLSPGEIAQVIGKSESSIHGLHHRGRRSVIAELTERGVAPATVRLPSA